MVIRLTKEEKDHLLHLYQEAQSAPVILVGNVNVSEAAWDRVRNYMDELGKKYGYDPQKMGIKPDGTVVPR